MLENISLDTPILYLTVSDRDAGDNGRVSVELLPSLLHQIPLVQLERISENTYVIKSHARLDREEKSFHTFTLTTSDHGQAKHSIEHRFELHLIDTNDCSPMFEHSSNYTFYIDENNEENALLHTIEVTDSDEDDRITLKLLNIDKNLFHINEQNQLIISSSLDYEKQSVYQFVIRAEDSVGHQTHQSVFVYLNDLNDNPVRFLTNFTRFQLEENQENSIFLGQILAEDADQNDRIIYSIHPDDIQPLNQSIEFTSNGSLYTKKSFDREQINQFQFRLLANDSLHVDMMLIEIDIIDQNDHRPVLKTSSPLCYISNSSNQTIEIHLEGDDPDEDENGQIVFSLKNPSSNDIHLLSNGTLLVSEGFNREYRLNLILTDQSQSNVLSTTYEDFLLLIVSEEGQCRNYSIRSSIEYDQDTFMYFLSILLISLALFTIIILIICGCCYFQQQKQSPIPSFNSKTNNNLTPSFSSSLNDDAEQDTLLISSPSPQFTAMTTISTSTNDSTRLTTFIERNPTTKSSSLSSSSSSTYIKMSRSFEDEML